MLLVRKTFVLLTVATLSLAILSDAAFAQPPGGGGRGRFGGGFGGFGGGGLDLLQNESVQKELELLDDQIAQIRELADSNDTRSRLREALGELRDLPDDQRREKFGQIMAEIREETQKQIDKILLPHQGERLRQIEFQLSARRSGGVLSGELADELGITEAQREEMRAAAEKAFEELREKQRQLQQEAQEKILAVLSPAQRARYKQLVGEPFDYQPDRGGRSGFGGRAGNTGGGRRGVQPGN